MKGRRPKDLSVEELSMEGRRLRERRQRARSVASSLTSSTDSYCSLLDSGLPLDEGDHIDVVEDENGQPVPKLVRAISVN